MVVKKFEARSMKEALEMVKAELGPQAIILAAKDYSRKYGLIGENSVEVTAAVSEGSMHKKKFTDQKIRESDRLKLNKSPAKVQTEIINRVVANQIEKNTPPRAITSTRYIEIEEHQEKQLELGGHSITAEIKDSAADRIKTAAQRAWQVMQSQEPSIKTLLPVKEVKPKEQEIDFLKREISDLKGILANFKQIPQTFVGSHPGSDYGLHFDVSFMFEKLVHSGLLPEYVAPVLLEAQKSLSPLVLKKRGAVEAFSAKYILNSISIAENQPTKVHLFVGASGQGKTSSLIKMACNMSIKERKKIAILTTDFIKVGAAEQLKIYSQILNVPFAIIKNEFDWRKIEPQLSNIDALFVDFPGLNLKTLDEISLIKNILPPASFNPAIHFVLSTTAKDFDSFELGRRYSSVNFSDVIFTGLDESTHHGLIYNFQKRFDKPIFAFGTGSRIPEDFEKATKERILDLIFKITKERLYKK
jgi:flagellar biosynthesis protein FlhF